VRSGTFYFTGLECTFHVKRLGSLIVDFNKARQCTGRVGLRQYLIVAGGNILTIWRICPRNAVNRAQNIVLFGRPSLRGLWISIVLGSVGRG
jgi:hypothetical protein